MITSRALGLAISVLASAAVMAQSRPLPTDAAGRPVLDAAGTRLQYATSPATVPPALVPVAAPPSSIAGKPRDARSATSKLAAGSPDYSEVWRTRSFGRGIGATGIWSADLDSDGDEDLVLGGGNSQNVYWSIVTRNAEGNFEITWQSEPYGPFPLAITALRIVETDTARRIWIGFSDGRIDVVDGTTRELVATFNDTAEEISDFALADGDDDGTVDVLAATASQLLLYEPDAPGFTRAYPHGGAKIATGNVDADGSVEVALNGGTILQITGTDVLVEWSTLPFGELIDLGDVDGDGMAELVGAEAWQAIRAWDVDTKADKWSVTTSHDIGAIGLIDVTGDGVAELLYGDNQWGALHAIDSASQTELWSADNPEHGVTDLAVIDVDGDGTQELLWGAGWSSSGPDYLYVYDIATQSVEWQSADHSGPYRGPELGDVDADGKLEIVVASYVSDSGYGDGLVMVFDAATHALEWRGSSDLFDGGAWTGVHDLELVNVDADEQLEIAVGTDHFYDGALYIIDGLTHEMQASALYGLGSSPFWVLDSGDLTGDGTSELVAGDSATNSSLFALDSGDGSVIWKSTSLTGGFVTDIAAADVGLPGIDVIAAVGSSTIHAVRWSDKRHLTSAAADYQSVTAGDVTGTTDKEILAGRVNGSVDVLDGETLSVITSYAVCAEPVNALEMQAVHRFLAACGGSLLTYDVDSGSVLDSASVGVNHLGAYGSLAMAVVNGHSVVLAGGSEAVEFVDASGNQIPVLTPASATLHWRGEADLKLSATDGDADPLAFELVTYPVLGEVIWLDRSLGELRYTSSQIGKGQDNFEVRVSDGFHYSAPQTIEVVLENVAPEVSTTAVELHWRGEQTTSLDALDPDGDPLSFALDTPPAQGSAAIDAATGALTYTPAGAYVGPDSLTFTITDGADSVTETIQLELTNTAPTASAREFDMAGAMIASRFPAEDANDDPLTYAVIAEPSKGDLTFEPDTGLFEYTPDSGASGTDSLTFEVSDGIAQAQGTVDFHYASSPPPGNGAGGDGGDSGGGSSGWLLPVLLAAGLRRRRR